MAFIENIASRPFRTKWTGHRSDLPMKTIKEGPPFSWHGLWATKRRSTAWKNIVLGPKLRLRRAAPQAPPLSIPSGRKPNLHDNQDVIERWFGNHRSAQSQLVAIS
jgi:hypothetical protein